LMITRRHPSGAGYPHRRTMLAGRYRIFLK
jgi:hypothetical protein